MADPDRRTMIAVLSVNEGRRSTCYADSKGIPTVGVGFNLMRADARTRIEALGCDFEAVLAGDLALDEARRVVLADMAFNLGGPRLAGFKKMLAAVTEEDWERAADEMMESRWYREVGHRGVRNVAVMRSGALVADYVPTVRDGTATV